MTLNLKKTPLQLFSKKLVKLKYIQHIQYDLKKSDVKKLEYKIKYLNQTYIFHLIANWQDFIETLVEDKFNTIQSSQKVHKLNSVLTNNLENKLKRFNTPNIENIDLLFKDVLGITKITDCFNKNDMTRKFAKKSLDRILKMRHQIAHTGSTNNVINYESNFKDMNFIFQLATLLQEEVDKQD